MEPRIATASKADVSGTEGQLRLYLKLCTAAWSHLVNVLLKIVEPVASRPLQLVDALFCIFYQRIVTHGRA